jgi:hypothetical protein
VFSSGFQGKSRLRMHQTGSRGGAKAWGTVGMPCPDLQPETGASRDTAGPDYSRQTFIHPR